MWRQCRFHKQDKEVERNTESYYLEVIKPNKAGICVSDLNVLRWWEAAAQRSYCRFGFLCWFKVRIKVFCVNTCMSWWREIFYTYAARDSIHLQLEWNVVHTTQTAASGFDALWVRLFAWRSYTCGKPQQPLQWRQSSAVFQTSNLSFCVDLSSRFNQCCSLLLYIMESSSFFSFPLATYILFRNVKASVLYTSLSQQT